MSDFQIIISEGSSASADDGQTLGYKNHSKDAVVERIQNMEKMWPEVIEKLSSIAEKSEPSDKASGLVLDKVEFNIGIEAGLNFGLVSKGTAAVTVSFVRKP